MTARKFLLWALPVLIIAVIVVPRLIEKRYESDRKEGWFTHLAPSPGETHGAIITCGSDGQILMDGQGNVWVTGTGPCNTSNHIYMYDGESWTNMGRRLDEVLTLDGNGRIWRLGGARDEKYRISTLVFSVFVLGRWSNYAKVPAFQLDLDFNSWDTFAIDGQGRLWVGFRRWSQNKNLGPGVSFFDGNKWTTYTPQNSGLIGESRVTEIAFDHHQRVWIATERGGVSVFDGQAWTNYKGDDFGLPNLTGITAIAFDREGDAWLGTAQGGVIAQEGDQWIVHDVDDCAMYPCYLDIAFDQHGGTWIVNGHAAMIFDGESWTTLTPKNSGMAGGAITAVGVDAEGRTWFGTGGGISVMDAGEIKTIPNGWVEFSSSWFAGLYLFVPFILVSLWLAAVLNILRGVSLAAGLGLVSSMIFLLLGTGRNSDIVFILIPLVPATVLGVMGGVIGGLIDRGSSRNRLAVPLAITGMVVGYVIGFVLLFLLMYYGGF